MRRILYWYLPLFASLVALALFGYGLTQYLLGNTGTPVNIGASTTQQSAVPARDRQVAPAILGDSLARGAGDQSGLGIAGRLDAELKRLNRPARRTWNLGVNGARTPDLLRRLESANVRQLLTQSNVIIVSIGGNDLWGGTDWRSASAPDPNRVMDDVLGRIEMIIETIRKANPQARIFFIGLYNPFMSTPEGKMLTPLVQKWNARLLERFSGDPDFTLVQTADLFSHNDRLALDRFHPSGEGYGLIARRIAEAL